MPTTFSKLWAGCLLCGLLGFLAACELEREIELELPDYEAQPVIESYLSPGRPFTLLLTRSSGFFDTLILDNQRFIANTLINDAEVYVRYADTEVRLQPVLAFDAQLGQLYNYAAPQLVPDIRDSFYLTVRLADGTEARAATTILPAVPIDSNVVEFPEDVASLDTPRARILTYITDPDPAAVNRFQKILTYSPLDSLVAQDFIYTDETSQQAKIVTGTGYDFAVGDSIYIFNTHVSEDYEDYQASVQLALAANGNPFAQPSGIISNVQGSANPIGIFTGYPYRVDTVVIQAP